MNLRKIKGPNDAPQLHVAEIRNKAKQCTTLNCLGEKCYELSHLLRYIIYQILKILQKNMKLI